MIDKKDRYVIFCYFPLSLLQPLRLVYLLSSTEKNVLDDHCHELTDCRLHSFRHSAQTVRRAFLLKILSPKLARRILGPSHGNEVYE